MLEHGIIPNFTSVFLEPFYFGLCWETWGTGWMKEILCNPLRFAIFRQDLRNSRSCDELDFKKKILEVLSEKWNILKESVVAIRHKA
jgi:hypothetical protein